MVEVAWCWHHQSFCQRVYQHLKILCFVQQLIYAASYLINGVQTQLDMLDSAGYTTALQGNVILLATQGPAPCAVSEVSRKRKEHDDTVHSTAYKTCDIFFLQYNFSLISGAILVFVFYGIFIGVSSSRNTYFKNKNMRAYVFRAGLSKAPEELALEYGKRWRDLAKQRAAERRALGVGGVGGTRVFERTCTAEEEISSVLPQGETAREEARLTDSPTGLSEETEKGQNNHEDVESESPEEFLMRMLNRVGVLTRGQSHDLRRCSHEADAVCRAFSAATWLSRISMAVCSTWHPHNYFLRRRLECWLAGLFMCSPANRLWCGCFMTGAGGLSRWVILFHHCCTVLCFATICYPYRVIAENAVISRSSAVIKQILEVREWSGI